MKRILLFLMLIGLSSFAFADDNASTFALDEDCPLTDPSCPLPTGDVPPEDIPATTTAPSTTPPAVWEDNVSSADKIWFYLCISVNSVTRNYGIAFLPNYIRATYQAYNRCRATSGPLLAFFCGRPQCFSVNVPTQTPWPGGNFPGGPGGNFPGGPGGPNGPGPY